ncbi:thioredoxin domain-containing protein [Nitrospira sp. Kam-Ns4a]
MTETGDQREQIVPNNRLVQEASPYLRQHAHNPVDWYPWGAEALARAKAEDKPILLSIGYSACHWCHVMAHECFENPDIAQLMNERFVNVKVDREERPDLDDLYQKAVQVFTGRSGGWPLTVFLTPDQEPFYGGTYFPPVPRYNLPAFPQVLQSVAEAYHGRSADIQTNIERVRAGLRRVSVPQPSGEPLSAALLDGAVRELGFFYDPVHGGFGDGPKFPTAAPLNLLLRHHNRTKDGDALDLVTHTLRKMAAGGLYDHLGGGFHRYTVDARWLVPHFEKMLYDNAQLIRLYLDGWRLTGDDRFRQVVEETIAYLSREMTAPGGAFYAAQDADSEGEEGKYFLWTPAEVKAVLGTELGELFCRVYDVTETGNFEGKSILNRLGHASLPPEEMEEIERLLTPAKHKLLEVRERRVKPGLDDKILTGWNALAISALLDAYQALAEPAYLAKAERALAFLLDRGYRDGRLSRMVTEGRSRLNAYLDDYACLAAALVDAFEATAELAHLERAIELVELMLDRFWDPEGDGFFFTGSDHEALLQRMKPGTDSAVPSGNAVAALALLRLSAYTGEPRYRDRAERTLRLFRAQMDQNAYGSAAMLCAADLHLRGPQDIVLVGRRTDPALQEMRAVVGRRYLPNKTLVLVEDGAAGEAARFVPAAAKGKRAVDGRPTAYVCQQFTCSRPVTDWVTLERLLGGGE